MATILAGVWFRRAARFSRRLLVLSLAATALARLAVQPATAGELGATKPDLVTDYLNLQSPPPGDLAGFHRVRVAMARKAIADAHDAGFRFLRVPVAGFWPHNFGDKRNELALWQKDPSAYWAAMDQMFDDLDRAGVRLVPELLKQPQFAVLGHDTLHTFVTDLQSRSRSLFARYLREFITRYKDRKTILFYQLADEMNLAADLRLRSHCPKWRPGPCVWDHFSTAEMDRFAADLVALIKSLDPSRAVTSGYSMPRPAAWHLMRHPGFAPGGPDWTPDTPDEFRRYLILVHKPFDIVSVHIYPGRQAVRFGRPPGEEYKMVGDAAAAAKAAGKPLFVGEFGDRGVTPFMTHMLDALVRNRVAYAAIWTWEFYQTSTYQTHNTPASKFSLEPGYSDALIALLMKTEAALGAPPPPARPDAPPRVVLTWPLPCAMVDHPIDLAAVASDGTHAVKSVAFFVGGKKIGTATAFPYRARFDPAGLGHRAVEIDAQAVANSGATADFKSRVRLNGSDASCNVSAP